MWTAPRQLTGPQLRHAASSSLPWRQRLLLIGLLVVVGGFVGGFSAAQEDALLLLVGPTVAVVGVLLLQRTFLVRKRRAAGMVRVTPLQFDLLIALAHLPAHRVDTGRQLHDRLVWLLRQAPVDAAAVRDCEYWMWQVAAGQ